MNMKQFFAQKAEGFYVGAVSAVLALVTLFIYIGMDSMYFTALVVLGLVLGIVLFVLSAILRLPILSILAYFAYMFSMYHFLVLEIDYRMDVLVDKGVMGLDAIFVVAVIMYLLTIIVAIVSTCLNQEKQVKKA